MIHLVFIYICEQKDLWFITSFLYYCFRGGNASLACLVDTPHQTRVVELLIINAENLFGPIEDHMLIHGETAVEQMEQRNTLQVPQPATIGTVSPECIVKQ